MTDLVRAHFRYVWRLLRRLGLPATDADDAAQQVFLVAARRIDAIARGSERAFLYGTALNVVAKWRAAAARRPEPLEDPEALADASIDADAALDQHRARELLDTILAELPLELRAVFVLYEIEELTAAEVAAITALPAGTVASRLRRAREAFTEHVHRHEARRRFRARPIDEEPK